MFQDLVDEYWSQNAYVIGFIAGILILSIVVGLVACRVFVTMSKMPDDDDDANYDEHDASDDDQGYDPASPRVNDSKMRRPASLKIPSAKGDIEVLEYGNVFYHLLPTREKVQQLGRKRENNRENGEISGIGNSNKTEYYVEDDNDTLYDQQWKQKTKKTRDRKVTNHRWPEPLDENAEPTTTNNKTGLESSENAHDVQDSPLNNMLAVDQSNSFTLAQKVILDSTKHSVPKHQHSNSSIRHHKITKLRDKRFVNIDPLHVKQCEVCQWEILHDQEIFL